MSSTLFSRFLRPFMMKATSKQEFSSLSEMPDNAQKATVAAGCFWGVEHLFRKRFGDGKGLLDAKVGYSGGGTKSPSYSNVCSGGTGHAEALQITFDPSIVSYNHLVEFFYRMHDPTTLNRQGADTGTQYRSAIFYHGEEQGRAAHEITDKAANEWYKGKLITTQIVPAGQWWDAEEYHQLYLHRNPGGYECPAHFVRNFPPLSEWLASLGMEWGPKSRFFPVWLEVCQLLR